MARHRSHGPIVPALLVGALAVFLVSPLSAQEEVPAEGGRRLTTDTEAPPVEEACGAESPAASDLATRGQPYRTEMVSFAVRFQDEVNPYRPDRSTDAGVATRVGLSRRTRGLAGSR